MSRLYECVKKNCWAHFNEKKQKKTTLNVDLDDLKI